MQVGNPPPLPFFFFNQHLIHFFTSLVNKIKPGTIRQVGQKDLSFIKVNEPKNPRAQQRDAHFCSYRWIISHDFYKEHDR